MIDKDTAIRLVTQYINEHFGLDEELAIAPGETIEKNYGWVFFYNTKKYLETEVISYALGNFSITRGKGETITEDYGILG